MGDYWNEDIVRTSVANQKLDIEGEQPQKMSFYRKLWWFLNKKRGRNDLFLICAPSLVGSCNHKAMIELASFKKLK